MEEFSRHDIPREIWNILKVAVQHNIIDIVEVYVLAVQYKDNYKALVSDLTETSHLCRHHNGDGNRAVCKAADEFWKIANQPIAGKIT